MAAGSRIGLVKNFEKVLKAQQMSLAGVRIGGGY